MITSEALDLQKLAARRDPLHDSWKLSSSVKPGKSEMVSRSLPMETLQTRPRLWQSSQLGCESFLQPCVFVRTAHFGL